MPLLSPWRSYVRVIQCNPGFRLLWYAQIVSQLGDWFAIVALFALLHRLTGSGQAISGLFIAQFLPTITVGLWAGAVVDRWPRKAVLIVTSFGRALLAASYLLVREPQHAWFIYVATILIGIFTTFFEPARMASIPMVVRREDLVLTNTLVGATWATVVALGAALGGLVAGVFGIELAILLNVSTYTLAGIFMMRTPMPAAHWRSVDLVPGLRSIAEGLHYVWHRPALLLYTLSKALWSLGGGVLVLLPLFGQRVFPYGVDGAVSVGLLYAARGIGAAIGPLVAGVWGSSSLASLRQALGPAILVTACGYAGLSVAPSLVMGLFAVLVAHVGSGVLWAFSTALIQSEAPPHLHGRIFSAELVAMILTAALSIYAVGVAADVGWAPRMLAFALGGVFVLAGLVLTLALWRCSQQPR